MFLPLAALSNGGRFLNGELMLVVCLIIISVLLAAALLFGFIDGYVRKYQMHRKSVTVASLLFPTYWLGYWLGRILFFEIV